VEPVAGADNSESITVDSKLPAIVPASRPIVSLTRRVANIARRWREKLLSVFSMAPYYVFVDGLTKPIPLTREGALQVQEIMQMDFSQRPKTLTMMWGDGQEGICIYVDRITALSTTNARLWFGPNPFSQTGS
jgi:hypothetical protein